MTKVTVYYDPYGHIYAFSENEEYILLLESQRKLRGFYKKVLHLSKMQYKSFLYFYNNKLLFENILTDGKETFTFITTYDEESYLSSKCDQIWDTLWDMEKMFLDFPLDDSIRQSLNRIIESRKRENGKFGKFNTFNIFIELFKKSIL